MSSTMAARLAKAMLLGLAAMAVLSATAQAGLVGYWPLDGNANAVLGANGNLVGGPTVVADRNGQSGGALGFASTGPASGSYVEIPGGGGLSGAASGTISMWVRWSGTQDPACCGGTLGNVAARQQNGVFSNDILGLNAADPATATLTWMPYGAGPGMVGTTAVGNNTWRHVAVAFQSGQHRLYLDGVLQGTSAAAGTMNTSATTPLTLGAWTGDGAGYSTSWIDDVAVFDNPLTPSQVFALAHQTATPQALPSQIAANAQAPDYYAPDDRRPRHLTDGSGLTPDNDGDGIPQHGTTPGGTMWLTNNTAASTDRWVKFDLNGLYTLDSMRIWNYNEPGGFLARQVQTALVQYSADGINWTTLGSGPRTMATGATGTAAYDSPEEISFGNAPVRFVRLGNPANPLLEINPSTGDHVGLSEVQFFGDPIPSTVGPQLTAATAAASSYWGSRSPSMAVSAAGVGLTGDADADGMPEHNNNADNMWLSNGQPTPWFRIDAGEVVRLDQLRIWNHNEGTGTFNTRSIRTATIKYAGEGQVANLNDRNDPGWTVLAANVPFTKGDQTNNYEAVDEFFFGSAGPAIGRYLLIDVSANYGDASYTGLAEAQVFGLRPLSGVMAAASSQLALPDNTFFNRPAANTVDGMGKTTTTPDGNPGSGVGMWLTAGNGFPTSTVNDTNPQITFDLGLPYALDALVLYNYNEAGAFTNRGVQEAEVLISFDPSFSDARSLGVFTFDKAPGDAGNPGQSVLMDGLVARFVRLDILSNYNGARYHDGVYGSDFAFVGLNEVQFIGSLSVPEPGSAALLGIALGALACGVCWSRARRAKQAPQR